MPLGVAADHTPGVRRILLVLALCGLGCGGRERPPATPARAQSATPAAQLSAPAGTLWREDVESVLAAGPGRFLQKVSVDPLVDGGAFVGWELLSLQPAGFWQGVDLRPGDVVISINGLPVERPEHALAIFGALKKASELRVSYLRGAEERELAYRILPRAVGADSRGRAAAGDLAKSAPPGKTH